MRSSLASTPSRYSSRKWIQNCEKNNAPGGGQILKIENISDIFQEVERKPCSLISIFGRARQGKSFLMNVLAGETDIFKISNEKESCTQGIDISNRWLSVTDFSRVDRGTLVRSENYVGFVDAEGQGDKDVKYDATLVCPILLASKCVIFNWKGDLQKEHLLQTLAIMAKAAENVRVESSFGGGAKKFGHLHICFRDWQAVNSDRNGVKNDLFNEEKGNAGAEERNKIRRDLKACFETITVWLFPAPVSNTATLKEKLRIDVCSQEFRDEVRRLRGDLSHQLSDASFMGGRPLTGNSMARYVNEIAICLNQGNVVLPQSAYSGMIKQEVDIMYNRTRENLDSDLSVYISHISILASECNESFPNENEAKKTFNDYFATFRDEFNGELGLSIGDAPPSMTREITRDIPHTDALMEGVKERHFQIFINQYRSKQHEFFASFRRNGDEYLIDLRKYFLSTEGLEHVKECEDLDKIESLLWSELSQFLIVKFESKWSQSDAWKEIFKSWGNTIKLSSQDILKLAQQHIEKRKRADAEKAAAEKVAIEQSKKKADKFLKESKDELDNSLPFVLKDLDSRNPSGFKFDNAMAEMNGIYRDIKSKLKADLESIQFPHEEIITSFKVHAEKISGNLPKCYDAARSTTFEKIASEFLAEISKVSKSISLKSFQKEKLKTKFADLSEEAFVAHVDDKFFQAQYIKIIEPYKKMISGWDDEAGSFWGEIEEVRILKKAQEEFSTCKDRVLSEWYDLVEQSKPPPPPPAAAVSKKPVAAATASTASSLGAKRTRTTASENSRLSDYEAAMLSMQRDYGINHLENIAKRRKHAAVSLGLQTFVKAEHDKTKRSMTMQKAVKIKFEDEDNMSNNTLSKSTPAKAATARGSIQESILSQRAAAASGGGGSSVVGSSSSSVKGRKDAGFKESVSNESKTAIVPAPSRRILTQDELRAEIAAKRGGGAGAKR